MHAHASTPSRGDAVTHAQAHGGRPSAAGLSVALGAAKETLVGPRWSARLWLGGGEVGRCWVRMSLRPWTELWARVWPTD